MSHLTEDPPYFSTTLNTGLRDLTLPCNSVVIQHVGDTFLCSPYFDSSFIITCYLLQALVHRDIRSLKTKCKTQSSSVLPREYLL